MEKESLIADLKISLQEIMDTEQKLITFLNETVNEPGGVELLINTKIGKLFELAEAYKRAFERVSVSTKGDFLKVVEKCYRNTDVQDLEENIHALETDISSLNGRIIVISFGDQHGAAVWLNETKCSFPMLLDQQRKIYSSFGLHRSVLKVWGIDEMIYYAEKLAQNVPLPNASEYVNDDPQQMGGDFILDNKGVVRYIYCSKKSYDRPDIKEILHELKRLI